MATPPPPAPLGREEFNRRWATGARTMAELDPEFWGWCEAARRRGRIARRVLRPLAIAMCAVGLALALYVLLGS